MTSKSIDTTVSLRDTIKSIVKGAKGLTNDEVIEILRRDHQPTLTKAQAYIERIGLVKFISDITDSRRSAPLFDQNQGELFDLPIPQFISIVVLEDGKPKRIRKDFLDATLEEAERDLEPTQPRVPNVDKNARKRAFVEKLKPIMVPGMTFRDGIALLRSRSEHVK